MSDSTFVNINGRFYCIVNVFNEETYCHIHNRRDKSKKLSMKIGDLRDLIQASDKFEEAYDKVNNNNINEETDSVSHSDDDDEDDDLDQAYKNSKARSRSSPPPKKKKKKVMKNIKK